MDEQKITYAFIDASNLFYGGEKSLGWKIDYRKLLAYIQKKYGMSKAFYFGGVETHTLRYNYLAYETVPLQELEAHLTEFMRHNRSTITDAHLELLDRHLRRIHFYQKLQEFGYLLYLKPVKKYEDDDGTIKRKANCDVEMTFHLMKELDNFDRVLILSGDGDFLPILKYLKYLLMYNEI